MVYIQTPKNIKLKIKFKKKILHWFHSEKEKYQKIKKNKKTNAKRWLVMILLIIKR